MAQLRSHYDEIQRLNGRVVVISFSTPYWVRVWLDEMQVPFLTLLDPPRRAYQAYGLERSMLRAWGAKNLWYYFKAVLRGRRMRSWHGDDTGQLGGNFVVDTGGIVRYVYPSHDPTDRPAVEDLLQVLRQLD